jgi:site-specific DNA-methyltransferase (adenine-specific)
MNEDIQLNNPQTAACFLPHVSRCPSINFFNVDNVEFMKSKPDKYYDLAIVDPPYGINVAKLAYTQEENRPCKQKNGTTLRIKKLKYKHYVY